MSYEQLHKFKCDQCNDIVFEKTSLAPVGWIIKQTNTEESTTRSWYFCSWKCDIAHSRSELKEAANGSRSNGRGSKKDAGS